MKIDLIITGLTNMKDDYRCISGYDFVKKRFLRPLLNNNRIDVNFASQHLKEIKMFRQTTFEVDEFFNAQAPHSEDFYVKYDIIKSVDIYDKKQIDLFLRDIADESVQNVYGDFIEIIDGYPIVPMNLGKRSLGVVIAKRCKVYQNDKGRTRVDFSDQSGYELKNVPCVAHDAEYKINGIYNDIPIRLGLTRLWKKDGMTEPAYWIQISGIFP